jgi:precorrin-4 methylase
MVADVGDDALDHPWLLVDFPVALVARAAWPDDAAAIAAAFGDH